MSKEKEEEHMEEEEEKEIEEEKEEQARSSQVFYSYINSVLFCTLHKKSS
jgi:hypothetical protein